MEPEARAGWRQQHDGLALPRGVASFVAGVLRQRLQSPEVPTFRRLIEEVFGGLGEGLSGDALQEAYLARRDRWQSDCGDRIDLYFTNYCRNYWMKEWYVVSPDLSIHLQYLLLRLAMLRFLFFCNPALDAAAAAAGDEKQRLLDAAAVSTFYRFSRGIVHGLGFERQLRRLAQDPQCRALSPYLLKL
jgi:hypothetical protein